MKRYEILELVDKLIDDDSFDCLNCNHELYMSNSSNYDHDGGIFLVGYERKQWLYFTCSECKYQNAVGKLMAKRLTKRINNFHD